MSIRLRISTRTRKPPTNYSNDYQQQVMETSNQKTVTSKQKKRKPKQLQQFEDLAHILVDFVGTINRKWTSIFAREKKQIQKSCSQQKRSHDQNIDILNQNKQTFMKRSARIKEKILKQTTESIRQSDAHSETAHQKIQIAMTKSKVVDAAGQERSVQNMQKTKEIAKKKKIRFKAVFRGPDPEFMDQQQQIEAKEQNHFQISINTAMQKYQKKNQQSTLTLPVPSTQNPNKIGKSQNLCHVLIAYNTFADIFSKKMSENVLQPSQEQFDPTYLARRKKKQLHEKTEEREQQIINQQQENEEKCEKQDIGQKAEENHGQTVKANKKRGSKKLQGALLNKSKKTKVEKSKKLETQSESHIIPISQQSQFQQGGQHQPQIIMQFFPESEMIPQMAPQLQMVPQPQMAPQPQMGPESQMTIELEPEEQGPKERKKKGAKAKQNKK